MRKYLIPILLAGAASSPAFAEPQGRDREERQEMRQERQQQREERQQTREQVRVERPSPRFESRSEPLSVQPPQPQVEVRQRSFDRGAGADATARANRADIEQIRDARRAQRADGTSRWTRDNVQQPGETARWTRDPSQRAGETNRWTRDRTGWNRNGDLRHSDRPVPDVMRSPSPLIVSDSPREGTQPRLRSDSRRQVATNWTNNWRRDHRYDWRSYRDRNRSAFNVGVYYDPFGWSYRPYQIGWRLWPSYYSSRFWINDPWQYRLPYAPVGTVWVRYWDDAILVDRWTGEVVDVIHNFFW